VGKLQEVPYLAKISKNIPWGFLELSSDLLNNSFLIKPKPYISWKIKVGKLLDQEHSKLYYKQKEICPICKKPLIEENIDTSQEDQFIKDDNAFLIVDKDFNNLIDRKGLDHHYYKSDQVFNQYTRGKKWYAGLHVDHTISKTLAKISSYKEILADLSNKQLLHKQCHIEKKTAFDTLLIRTFRQLINKELHKVNKKLKTASTKELILSNYNAIQLLIKDKLVMDTINTSSFYSKGKSSLTKLKELSHPNSLPSPVRIKSNPLHVINFIG